MMKERKAAKSSPRLTIPACDAKLLEKLKRLKKRRRQAGGAIVMA